MDRCAGCMTINFHFLMSFHLQNRSYFPFQVETVTRNSEWIGQLEIFVSQDEQVFPRALQLEAILGKKNQQSEL